MKKVYIIVLIVFCIFISCFDINKKNKIDEIIPADSISVRIDSLIVDDEIIRYSYYGTKSKGSPDSMKFFYRYSRNLQSIFYMGNSDRYVSKSFYKNGKIKQIQFSYSYREPHKGDTLSVIYYENGMIGSVEISQQDSQVYPTSFVSYYMNGNMKEKGEYDLYNAVTVNSGIWSVYDSLDNSRLKEETYYHLDQQGKDYIVHTIYDQKGAVQSKRIFNNYVLYESEPNELKKIPQ